MKLILRIDGLILEFFNKIAKDFNWLTGKDNFFLARIILVGISLWYCTLIHAELKLNHFPAPISVPVASSLFLFSFLFFYSCIAQEIRLKEMFNGIKDSGFCSVNTILRYLTPMSFIFTLITPFFFQIMFFNFLGIFFGTNLLSILMRPTNNVSVIFMFLVLSYFSLLGIDHPPFKKSQAWQKIKNWFKIPSSQTELKPATIPIPHN